MGPPGRDGGPALRGPAEGLGANWYASPGCAPAAGPRVGAAAKESSGTGRHTPRSGSASMKAESSSSCLAAPVSGSSRARRISAMVARSTDSWNSVSMAISWRVMGFGPLWGRSGLSARALGGHMAAQGAQTPFARRLTRPPARRRPRPVPGRPGLSRRAPRRRCSSASHTLSAISAVSALRSGWA